MYIWGGVLVNCSFDLVLRLLFGVGRAHGQRLGRVVPSLLAPVHHLLHLRPIVFLAHRVRDKTDVRENGLTVRSRNNCSMPRNTPGFRRQSPDLIVIDSTSPVPSIPSLARNFR
jgi:hypothetical protein